jgi:hypothetical protein
MVLLFSFLESMKNVQTHLPNFQSSAAGSQAGAAELVQFIRHRALCGAPMRNFRGSSCPTRFSLVKGH